MGTEDRSGCLLGPAWRAEENPCTGCNGHRQARTGGLSRKKAKLNQRLFPDFREQHKILFFIGVYAAQQLPNWNMSRFFPNFLPQKTDLTFGEATENQGIERRSTRKDVENVKFGCNR